MLLARFARPFQPAGCLACNDVERGAILPKPCKARRFLQIHLILCAILLLVAGIAALKYDLVVVPSSEVVSHSTEHAGMPEARSAVTEDAPATSPVASPATIPATMHAAIPATVPDTMPTTRSASMSNLIKRFWLPDFLGNCTTCPNLCYYCHTGILPEALGPDEHWWYKVGCHMLDDSVQHPGGKKRDLSNAETMYPGHLPATDPPFHSATHMKRDLSSAETMYPGHLPATDPPFHSATHMKRQLIASPAFPSTVGSSAPDVDMPVIDPDDLPWQSPCSADGFCMGTETGPMIPAEDFPMPNWSDTNIMGPNSDLDSPY